MISRKKRVSYRHDAMMIAKANGLPLDPDDWNQVWNMLDAYGKTTYVYAIVDNKNAMVKFGKSSTPGSRIRTIKTSNPQDLKLAAFCPERPGLNEKSVHAEIKQFQVWGEWFRLNPKTTAVIDRIRAAAIPPVIFIGHPA